MNVVEEVHQEFLDNGHAEEVLSNERATKHHIYLLARRPLFSCWSGFYKNALVNRKNSHSKSEVSDNKSDTTEPDLVKLDAAESHKAMINKIQARPLALTKLKLKVDKKNGKGICGNYL
ncbi:unnamed protein product [Lepeophtheirus salmonis]|uniref:(salmon louse) hypothetical protein n=1 Tax=Lepeophtheirus salmonis TaxID=72036 RepID=A0A7R8HBL3_LEPSM|nr:unnamed protein product [Lepeophtheirus salmonis]CAF2974604.1 unnamed protein product [Lepeophtheirus salmonis]